MEDPETNAITQVAKALERLDVEAIARVIDWANKKFLSGSRGSTKPAEVAGNCQGNAAGKSATPRQVDSWQPSFSLFLQSTRPDSKLSEVLIAAYWLHRHLHQKEFSGYAVNQLLREVGCASRNITRDFSKLRSQRFISLSQKFGDQQQVKRLYRLTSDGISRVAQMLGHP